MQNFLIRNWSRITSHLVIVLLLSGATLFKKA